MVYYISRFFPLVLPWVLLSTPVVDGGLKGHPRHHKVDSQPMPTEPKKESFALKLSPENFAVVVGANDDVFVDFLAPWSVWDQRLAPIWEDFAREVKQQNLPLIVAKLDCVENADLCREHKIMAFPTLRWFHKGLTVPPDFRGDRTVETFVGYAREHLDLPEGDGHVPFEGSTDENDVEGDAYAEEAIDSHPDGVHEEVIPIEGDSDEEEEERPDPPQSTANSVMIATCQSAGLAFGRQEKQTHSEAGGVEFQEFTGLRVEVAAACRAAGSNARGKYNSFYAPCDFQFHIIPHAQESQSSMQLSTACSGENLYQPKGEKNPEPIADYVRGWPDECVGDYTRCYSVSKESERKIFLPHFCRNSWEIPSSVTHVSVDCKDDKQEALKYFDRDSNMDNPHLSLLEKHHREKIVVLLVIFLLACCGCWVFICLGYKLVIVPYLKAIKKSKSDPDLQSLVKSQA